MKAKFNIRKKNTFYNDNSILQENRNDSKNKLIMKKNSFITDNGSYPFAINK